MKRHPEMKSAEIGSLGEAVPRHAKPEKRAMRSFEADADVAAMLAEAKHDGIHIGEICNEALRHYGNAIISGLLTARTDAAQKWLARAKEKPDHLV
jgi:hypothetical protein